MRSNHFGIHVTAQMLSEPPAIATELKCCRPLHKPIVEILERNKDHDLRGLLEAVELSGVDMSTPHPRKRFGRFPATAAR